MIDKILEIGEVSFRILGLSLMGIGAILYVISVLIGV